MIKKILSKLRSGSFWVALIGALNLILTRLGYADAATLSENIVSGIASVLLIFGIAVSPARDNESTQTEDMHSVDESADGQDDANSMTSESADESDVKRD